MAASFPSDPHGRRYAQVCPLARALDVVGERWTLLIVRNLLVGPLRYGELGEGLPGVTTNLLAKRLKELSTRGLLEPRKLHGVTVYELTERGRALEPAVLALAAWGESEAIPKGAHRNLRWAMLGLRRRYRGNVVGTLRIICQKPEREFLLEFSQDEVVFLDAVRDATDVVVEGTEENLFTALSGPRSYRALLSSGALRLTGKKALFGQMLQSTFPSAPRHEESR